MKEPIEIAPLCFGLLLSARVNFKNVFRGVSRDVASDKAMLLPGVNLASPLCLKYDDKHR
jgi:hypothetical protein